MLKDITLGQYFPGDTIIHRLDPRTKLLLVLVYMILTFSINGFLGYLILAVFTFGCIFISRVPLKFVLKGLKPIFVFIVITGLFNLFLTGGDPVFHWWIFTITKQGLYFAAFMILRLVFLILGTSLLTLTTSPIALTDGLEHLLSPFKRIGLPAHELAMMMTIALRFIPTLMEETDKIIKAQSARGADFESGNLLRRAKAMVPILIPLFISAFRRADELATAMECRCYRGGENRTRLHELKYTKADSAAWLCFLLLAALLLALRFLPWTGGGAAL
ncbi:energy-coupling factor transporter transmembrane component T family protein [Ructibacterium gallinarum]|uniref:Energy-coupling factor transporter transmembrane protein EcfT n=1 Tax=Ructibacterium gallinarum TaxID=2779355 RepID=A0A9D5LZK2_9FIRM|nr:energy-coupling factor transporter transmembrane component T [Ructibacterium gallinarum]MBE5039862.1 energy-coupling factor transporter transmembrane protein EcfT [Ructibacterium gallinarum]